MSTEAIIFTVFSELAGIVLCVLTLIFNRDKLTGKINHGWWISAIGFLVFFCVLVPILCAMEPASHSKTFIAWLSGVVVGVAGVSWLLGKILSRH